MSGEIKNQRHDRYVVSDFMTWLCQEIQSLDWSLSQGFDCRSEASRDYLIKCRDRVTALVEEFGAFETEAVE